MSFKMARQVSRLPVTYETSDKSTAGLLRDVAHPDALRELSEAHIAQVLTAEPELMDLWFKRGTDQRMSGGWGVEGTDGDYRVQSFAGSECLNFHDRAQACAAFIVRYVSYISTIASRRSS